MAEVHVQAAFVRKVFVPGSREPTAPAQLYWRVLAVPTCY